MNINIISAVSAMGALNGFLIALFLLLRDRRSGVRLPLILYIVLLSTYILGISLKHLGISDLLFQWIYFNDILYGILIYLYVRNKIANRFVFFKRDFLYIIPIFVAYSGAQILFLQDGSVVLKWTIELIVDLVFVCLALKLLASYLKKQDSIVKNESFRKLNYLIIICLMIDLVELILFGFYVATRSDAYLYLYLNILYTIAIYVIGYNELLFNAITKREGKSLAVVDKSNIQERLLHLMKTENLHRNKGVKLSDIAERLDEKSSVISCVINDEIGKNFPDFINYYRVEDAKRILSKNSTNLSIEGIGYEVGFGTKSTFYAAFKKYTGKTPAQY